MEPKPFSRKNRKPGTLENELEKEMKLEFGEEFELDLNNADQFFKEEAVDLDFVLEDILDEHF